MDLEAVLAEHPAEADALRPVLAAAAWVRMDIPPPSRRLEGKEALMAACALRRREVETTQGYINEIKAGVPLDELLANATPAMRPLVIAAWRMHTTPAPAPDAEKVEAGKLALMAMVEARRASVQVARPASERIRSGMAGLWQGLAPRPSLARRAWASSLGTLAALVVIGAGAAGVSTAAAASLPGDAFYPVKRLGEHARLWLTLDPDRKADINARIDAERLAEISLLIDEGREISAEMLAQWLRGQPDALGKIQGLSEATQAQLGEHMQGLLAAGAILDELAGDAALADELRQWLGELARAADDARASGGAGELPDGREQVSPVHSQPVSAEDLGAQPVPLRPVAKPRVAAPAAPAIALPPPNVPVPVADETEDLASMPQSGGDYGPEEPEEDENERTGTGSSAASTEPSASPTPQEIIQVPWEPEPTPTAPPGGSGGANPAPPAPGEPGPNDPEPGPSITPQTGP